MVICKDCTQYVEWGRVPGDQLIGGICRHVSSVRTDPVSGDEVFWAPRFCIDDNPRCQCPVFQQKDKEEKK